MILMVSSWQAPQNHTGTAHCGSVLRSVVGKEKFNSTMEGEGGDGGDVMHACLPPAASSSGARRPGSSAAGGSGAGKAVAWGRDHVLVAGGGNKGNNSNSNDDDDDDEEGSGRDDLKPLPQPRPPGPWSGIVTAVLDWWDVVNRGAEARHREAAGGGPAVVRRGTTTSDADEWLTPVADVPNMDSEEEDEEEDEAERARVGLEVQDRGGGGDNGGGLGSGGDRGGERRSCLVPVV